MLREHDTRTVVPAEFFDELLTALDSPGEANTSLSRASQRARNLVTG